MLSPQHLAVLAAHMADHLTGKPLPPLPPQEMAARWALLAKVQEIINAPAASPAPTEPVKD